MLTLFDLGDNLRNEYANTPNVLQKDIRKKYTEDNLMFVMTGNRMNGYICTYAFVKNGRIEVCSDETFEDFSDVFPISWSIDYSENKDNSKYALYWCGWGSILYVDKRVNKEFLDELIKQAKEYEIPFRDGLPAEHFIFAYWLTIAKKIIGNKNEV